MSTIKTQEPDNAERNTGMGEAAKKERLAALPEGQEEQVQSPGDVNRCRKCGKEIVQVAKRKKRIFCSDTCRQKWWNSHLFLVNQSSEALHHFTCPTCNKPFTTYGKRKFCSHHCYIRSRYY